MVMLQRASRISLPLNNKKKSIHYNEN